MALNLVPPDDDRRELFEKSIKPLLVAAQDNNAVDRWMFKLTKNGEVDKNVVAFVSSQHMKIFVINKIVETRSEVPDFLRSDYVESKQSFSSALHFRMKQARERYEPKLKVFRHGKPRPQIVREKWSASIECWDIANSRYIGKTSVIRSPDNAPTLEILCECVDFELWVSGKLPDWFLSEEAHRWFVKKEQNN